MDADVNQAVASKLNEKDGKEAENGVGRSVDVIHVFTNRNRIK